MLTTAMAYLLIGCFLVLERALRKGQQASSLEAEETDRGSTRLLGEAFAFAVLALLRTAAGRPRIADRIRTFRHADYWKQPG